MVARFGEFTTKNRSARTGHNPRTDEILKIPAVTVPAFKTANALRNVVNGR